MRVWRWLSCRLYSLICCSRLRLLRWKTSSSPSICMTLQWREPPAVLHEPYSAFMLSISFSLGSICRLSSLIL